MNEFLSQLPSPSPPSLFLRLYISKGFKAHSQKEEQEMEVGWPSCLPACLLAKINLQQQRKRKKEEERERERSPKNEVLLVVPSFLENDTKRYPKAINSFPSIHPISSRQQQQ